MKYQFKIPQSEIDRLQKKWEANPEKMLAVAKVMHDLTMKRFDTQGQSGGVKWKKKQIADGRPTLIGYTGQLKKSFIYGSTTTEALLGSTSPYAHVHQEGATIRAKSKLLWIPLTDKARWAYRYKRFKGLKFGIDFVRAKKVVIPARPMLPDSSRERRIIVKTLFNVLFGTKRRTSD